MSVFGGTASAAAPSPFGTLANNNTFGQTQPPANNVFGSFGGANNTSTAQTQQPPQQSSTPFGGFGQSNAQNAFGSNINANQTQNTNAFGQPPQGNPFGQTTNNQSTQSPFGQTMNNQATQPVFGQTMNNNNNNNQSQNFGGSTFNAPQQQPSQQQQMQQSMMQPRPNSSLIWQPGNSISPREKSIPEQMQLVLEKWNPESASCQFQHYFYNHVQSETVPYYGPAPGEDEGKWEQALTNKPNEGSIPVLCRGFSALGNRLRVQVQSVTSLQQRLHEINNSLAAMLQNHDLEISVRTVDAKRRHVALSQRCLQLATKVQLLRNRGYAMDSAEEELRQKLTELERGVFDPLLSGRQEEIWARMVGIRARARVLQEEMERSGVQGGQQSSDAIDEEVMRKVKKILGDYDSQISHLQRELDEIRKEYAVWESSRSAQSSA